jgi:hypothetical protein
VKSSLEGDLKILKIDKLGKKKALNHKPQAT